MANQSMDLFLQSCGAGPLRLGVEHPTARAPLRWEFEQPFLLVGRDAGADLPLNDSAVSRRHAYLQVIAGHVFCLDLHSRTGVLWDGQPQRSGWLEPDRAVGIGPFAVRLLGVGPANGAATPDAWDPLAALPPGEDPLPPVSLEVLSGNRRGALWRMDRTLALVGQDAQGTVQVSRRKVTQPHCSLLRTPLGLWVIDLRAPEGITVNGARVRYARLEDGDELLVSGLSFGVRYHAPVPASAPPRAAGATGPNALAPVMPPSREAERAEQERFDAARRQWQEQMDALHREFDQERLDLRGAVERVQQERAVLRRDGERLAADLARAIAEAEQRRDRLSAVEQSLAEASEARNDLVKGGTCWEAERLALREQWEREEQARVEEQERFDANRRQWQEQLDALHREFDQERLDLRCTVERLQQERAVLRKDGERLAADLARAITEAEQHRGRLSAVEQLLTEASVSHDDLVKAGQETAARWEAERLALREQREREQQARMEDQERFDANRRQWQQRQDALHREFDQERLDLRGAVERLQQERAVLRQDGERLAAELARARADAEQRRDRLSAVEQSLTEASASHDGLVKAGQEAAARWEAERLALRERWEREQQARVEEQERFDANRRQWQQQQDALHREFDQERLDMRGAVERVQHERAVLRQDGERLAAELARAIAETEQRQDRLSAVEQSLAEALASHDNLVKASQEAAARWEAERLTLREREQQARVEEQERFNANRRQWQEQLDALHREFDQERLDLRGAVERLQQERAVLRQDSERLAADLARAIAEAEQRRDRRSAVEQSLAEASASHDHLVKAGQEAAARWEAERLALRERWEREQQARVEEQERFNANRRQWQQQQDALHQEFDQERLDLRGEVERLQREAAILREDGERLASELARASSGEPAERARQAELQARQQQEAALRKDLEAARAEAADARRQWQELDAAHRQLDQERRALQEEVERLRREVAALRLELRQASTMSFTVSATPPVPAPAPAPAAPARTPAPVYRRDETAARDAFFIALSRVAPAASGGASRPPDRDPPPAAP